VLQWLRRERPKGEASFDHIPVLVLTARTKLAEQARGYEEGAVEYMTKPTQPSMVVERIRALLAMDPEQRDRRRHQRRDQQRKTLERLNAPQPDEFVY
jgi:DNA-binding response OmpR family regulator